MSQENVEVVRRAYEHFARTREPPWQFLHPQMEIHDHDALHGLRVYRGADQLAPFVAENADMFEDFRAEGEKFTDFGDRVLARVRLRGTEVTRIALTRHVFHVLTVKDGVITRLEAYPTETEALEAVGLRE